VTTEQLPIRSSDENSRAGELEIPELADAEYSVALCELGIFVDQAAEQGHDKVVFMQLEVG
jgi:hypothetical protein